MRWFRRRPPPSCTTCRHFHPDPRDGSIEYGTCAIGYKNAHGDGFADLNRENSSWLGWCGPRGRYWKPPLYPPPIWPEGAIG